ncbi:cytochrome c oxidase subunit 1 [Chytriomyces hyalinus]|nr:cytochrome c oxidase subunit 1 [Chytriomyces hyalinus]
MESAPSPSTVPDERGSSEKEDHAPESVEDMTALPQLTELAILENLKARFLAGHIYTYTGSILVALNPYKSLDIFGHQTIAKYENKTRSQNVPHIFALSENAISSIRSEKKNQSVIISGESGSGKSESTKYILSYVTAVTSHTSSVSWIHQQILEANTVLESFGNAKTSRNNNSSRFGKFIQVQLDGKARIVGSNITSYLLEKSRVAKQAKSERNYHVFYELLKGSNEEEVKEYNLKEPEFFAYLSQSGCTEIPGVDPRTKFEGLKFSLTVLNISSEETDGILRALSAILWLGNVCFKSHMGNESVRIEERTPLTVISNLLGVNESQLEKVLCFKKLVVLSEVTLVPLKPSQANDNRDSIAKNIYANLFKVLLELINTTLQTSCESDLVQNCIGVLDIFGFEGEMSINSFEQFCINFTNEKLQNFFNQFIFKLEQEEYEREGINWEKITYEDNQACLDLIEAKPTGILAQLDEEVKLPKGSEDSWLLKLSKTHGKHKHFFTQKTSKNVFGVKHYAGDVVYTVDGFLEKNKDALQDELFDLISSSSYPFIASIITTKDSELPPGSTPGTPKLGNSLVSVAGSTAFQSSPRLGGGSKQPAKVTAGGAFKNQLNQLVTTLSMTTTHYVRCIKPNTSMKAFEFDDTKVLAQLRYSGMMETIRIRKSGFPIRVPFEKFNMENRFLIGDEAKNSDDLKAQAASIVATAKVPADDWQAGKTKIFLRMESYLQVQKMTENIQKKSVITIQRYVKGYQARQKYLTLKANAIIIEKYIRGYLYIVRYRRTRKAIIKIQAVARGWFARDLYRTLKQEKELKLQEEKAQKEKELRELRELEAAELERLAGEKILADLKVAQAKLHEANEEAKAQKRLSRENSAIIAIDDLLHKVENMIPDPSAAASAAASTADTEKDDAKPVVSPAIADIPKTGTSSKKSGEKLDEIFSFIKEFNSNSHDELAALAENLTTEINQLYEKKKVLLSHEDISGNDNAESERPSEASIHAIEEGAGSMARKSIQDNPLVITDISEGKMDPFSESLSLQAFGELNFSKKKPANGFQDVETLLRYSKTPLTSPITRITEEEPSYFHALECSKIMLRALDPAPKKPEDVSIAMNNILAMGLQHVDLRDEVFIQTIKQITVPLEGEPKNWYEITVNGWQLLSLCVGTFPPSKTFSKYLLAFIMRGAKTNAGTKRMLALTAEQFSKNILMFGPRKFHPTVADISSFRDGIVNKLCKIYVMDGTSFDLLISPVTTADEVVKEISKKLKLKDTPCWSLYAVTWKSDRAIRSVDYLSDILFGLQKESKKGSFLKSLKPKHPDALDESAEMKLTLRKRIFRKPLESFTNKEETEIHLLCCQADHEVNADIYPIGLREGVKLAALKAQISLGDYNAASVALPSANNILQWITPRVLGKASKENASKLVVDDYMHLSGMSQLQAKVAYLELIKTCKFYGTALFEVETMAELSFNEPIVLGVSIAGVQIIQAINRELVMIFSSDEIRDVKLEDQQISISIGRANDTATEIYDFFTERAEEVATIIRDYVGVKNLNTKERTYTESELTNLKQDVERARFVLHESEIVRIPGPETLAAERLGPGPGSSKTVRGSLIMSKAVPPAEKGRKRSSFGAFLRTDVPNAVIMDYVDADWSFSTTRIVSSILASNSEVESWALSLNAFMMEFITPPKAAGSFGIDVVRSSRSNTVSPFIPKLQKLFDQCLENPVLTNELYLQLIKMTTKFSEKMAFSCLQMWKLMSISVGVVLPSQPEILDYLKAHLRRCEAVDPKDKLSEKEKSLFAKYALKTLYQTAKSGKRVFPPSTEEIFCTSKRSPINLRFYALNRQFRALPITTSDSIESIYCSLMDKFGLGEATGFAIYQYYAKSELALFAEDKISDVLYKCERASNMSQTSDKVHFIIKKRLFDEPLSRSNTLTEDEFIRSQIMEDIKNDRFPLKPEDMVHMAALNAQIAYGDSALGAIESYQEFSTKVIPKRLLKAEIVEQVLSEHAKLAGRSSKSCHDEFMNLAKLQPLYGYTVFSVLQSYTNQLPRECWLAVGFDGIRILARRSLAIFATHPYADVINYIPAKNNILLVTENRATLGTSKYVFSTENSLAIASLIKDYIDFHLDS